MKQMLSLLCLCFALAACTKAQDTVSQQLDVVGNETSASWDKMRDYLDVGHPKPAPQGSAQARYCYGTYEDVVCYAKPIPGEEYRLVGYQQSSGRTGYTIPPGYAGEDKTLPPLQSVNVGPPPKVVGTTKIANSNSPSDGTAPKKELKEIIFDPAELEPKTLVPDKAE